MLYYSPVFLLRTEGKDSKNINMFQIFCYKNIIFHSGSSLSTCVNRYRVFSIMAGYCSIRQGYLKLRLGYCRIRLGYSGKGRLSLQLLQLQFHFRFPYLPLKIVEIYLLLYLNIIIKFFKVLLEKRGKLICNCNDCN